MDPALAAFDAQLRNVVRPSPGDRLRERAGRVIRCVSGDPAGWSGVEWSDVDSGTADDVIAEQVAYFAGLGRSFEWKYYAYDRPADLPDRLRAAGLEAGAEEALMVARAADIPLDVPAPDGIEIRAADADADLDLVGRVHDEVFGGDHAAVVRHMREHREDVTAVLALADGRPVSAARVDFHRGTEFASLWGGGTVVGWRGRGIYGALVRLRVRLALDRGYTYLRTDALPTSRPILERAGFRHLTSTIPFTSPA